VWTYPLTSVNWPSWQCKVHHCQGLRLLHASTFSQALEHLILDWIWKVPIQVHFLADMRIRDFRNIQFMSDSITFSST
jgi:hypothetical protein